jgi:Histidine kinase-, DNA gyrase B-, and HSP90-like ATPase
MPHPLPLRKHEVVAVLVVRDEGIGIPAADLAHIFDRFARAGNVVGHFQGTGIGWPARGALWSSTGVPSLWRALKASAPPSRCGCPWRTPPWT